MQLGISVRSTVFLIVIAALAVLSAASRVEAKDVDQLTFAGTKIGFGSRANFLRLNKGNPLAQAAATKLPQQAGRADFLFYPDKDISLLLEGGDLRIKQKALVYVEETSSGVAIYDVSDRAGADVVYKELGKEYDLKPGEVLLISSSEKPSGFSQNFGYRRLTMLNQTKTHSVAKAEYAAFGAIKSIPKLNMLCQSDEPGCKKVAAQLYKTVAALQVSMPNHGAFKPASNQ